MRAEEQGASSGRRMVLAMKDAPRSAVLGSALYFFMLHGDAKRFLARHRKALAGLPVALFALGPFSDTPEDLASARGPIDKYLAKAEWLSPASVAVFGGRHDPSALRFPGQQPCDAQHARERRARLGGDPGLGRRVTAGARRGGFVGCRDSAAGGEEHSSPRHSVVA